LTTHSPLRARDADVPVTSPARRARRAVLNRGDERREERRRREERSWSEHGAALFEEETEVDERALPSPAQSRRCFHKRSATAGSSRCARTSDAGHSFSKSERAESRISV